jgi:hypothetical protein
VILRSDREQKSTDGTWQRDGPPEIVVARDSAIHKCSSSHDIISIDQNHSNLVKFADGDSDYVCILHFLQDIGPIARPPSTPLGDQQQQNRNISLMRGGKPRQGEISGSLEDNILSVFDTNHLHRNIPKPAE